MRSVDVVFPASMCAMIPMLRVSSSLHARGIICFRNPLVYETPTTDNARTPCSLPPCDAHLLSSSWPRRAHSPHRSIHPRACLPWSCPRAPANTAAASESPATACGTGLLPPEPGSSRHPRAASLLPATASRSRWLRSEEHTSELLSLRHL